MPTHDPGIGPLLTLRRVLIAVNAFTSCELMKTFATEDPVAYTFSHPEAKRILQVVLSEAGLGLEEVRARVGLHPETFHRVVRKLAQFDLVAVRAAPGAKFRKHRIPMVLEPSEKTRKMVSVLHKLDQVVVQSEPIVGQRTVQSLAIL
jgi:hypothetical protein